MVVEGSGKQVCVAWRKSVATDRITTRRCSFLFIFVVVSVWNLESARAVQVRSADQKLVRPKEALQPTRDIPANRATGQEIACQHDERIKSPHIVPHSESLAKRRSVTALSSNVRHGKRAVFIVEKSPKTGESRPK